MNPTVLTFLDSDYPFAVEQDTQKYRDPFHGNINMPETPQSHSLHQNEVGFSQQIQNFSSLPSVGLRRAGGENTILCVSMNSSASTAALATLSTFLLI